MNKYLSLLLFLVLLISCTKSTNNASPELYKSVRFLNQKNDDLTIKDVVKLYKNGAFNIPMENKVFQNIKDQQATWFHFKIPHFEEDKFFSFWGAFLEYGKVYLHYNDNIKEQKELSLKDFKNYNSEYRFPTWKLEKTATTTDVFVKVKDSKRVTSLKLLLFNSSEFIKFTQKDSTIIGFLLAYFLAMLIAIGSLFLVKKQYSLLWYAAYVFIFGFDLITNHGIDLQLNIFSTATQHSIKRLLFQSIGAISIGMFYISFYPFTRETAYVKKILKFIIGIYILSAMIMFSFIIFDSIYLPKIYLWLPQRIIMPFVLIAHLILIRKKVIPFYLSIGFILTLLIYLRFLYDNPKLDLSLLHYFILDNSFYLAIAVETGLILFYIISQLVKSEFLAVNLQKENLTLRNNFQNNILEVQELERKKLLGNVHDSFGGYLEALKLRLLDKKDNTNENVQEILDAFYKEYRYLLNSLYSPTINSENFIDNLIEFCNKLNQLTGNNYIKHQFSIQNTKLSQEKCLHLYRIISELTTNAIKHSNASHITISLSQNSSNEIILTVTDNGIGINKEQSKSNSYGLKNIANRIKSIDGKVRIEAEKNKGTTFIINIPTTNR